MTWMILPLNFRVVEMYGRTLRGQHVETRACRASISPNRRPSATRLQAVGGRAEYCRNVTVRSVSRRTDVNRRPFTALRSEGVNDSIVARRQPLVILLLIRPKCIDRFVFKLSVGLPYDLKV